MNIIFGLLLTLAHADISVLVDNGNLVPASAAINRSIAYLTLSNQTVCSASFLDSKTLITAGHCTSGIRASGSYVNVRDSGGVWHRVPVKSLTPHPLYQLQKTAAGTYVKYDMGIVKMQYKFSFAVRPVTITSFADVVGKTENVVIAGYGWDKHANTLGVLRTGSMKASYGDVANFFGRKGVRLNITSADQVVCPGDSGGAVLRGTAGSTQLIGVNSLSSGCSGATAPFAFSEAPAQQLKWIKTFLN